MNEKQSRKCPKKQKFLKRNLKLNLNAEPKTFYLGNVKTDTYHFKDLQHRLVP